MVEELLRKNKDLQEQAAKLMEEKKKGSESSWSEVVEPRTPMRRPGGARQMGRRFPRIHQGIIRKSCHRYHHALLSWDLENYEVEEVQRPKGRQMDWAWVPGGHGGLQPGQDDRGAGSRHGTKLGESVCGDEILSELKELLEKQQRTSEQRWSGYFSKPVHSYGREQHDRRGGREEEERPSEEQATTQRVTGDGAGNVNTTNKLPVLEAGQNTSPLVLGD